jgi:hypothetical protein
MQSRSRTWVAAATLVSLLVGCKREQAAKPGVEPHAELGTPELGTPEPRPSPEAEPPPPPEPPAPVEPTPSPGAGFELGSKPEARVGKYPPTINSIEPLHHAGASVSVNADQSSSAEDEDNVTVKVQVRVEFEGVDGQLGHNHVRVAGRYWDELVLGLQEIAKLDDGRWLVDAQLTSRTGEDYFWAESEHTLIVVDPKARAAAVLWTGVGTGSNAMDVCVSFSFYSFEVRREQLIIRRTEVTTLDRENAKELTAAAEGCVAKPETTREVERISLTRSQ